jgi:hypothetical protein
VCRACLLHRQKHRPDLVTGLLRHHVLLLPNYLQTSAKRPIRHHG